MFTCVDANVLQACIDGSVEMVSFLVEHGASVNQADSEGWTPLHVAASCGYPDIAEWVESWLQFNNTPWKVLMNRKLKHEWT